MLTICGFNGFGQFGVEHGCRINQPKGITFEASTDVKSELLVATWSYTAFAAGCQLWLKGCLQNKPNAHLTLITADPIKQLAACDKYCLVLLESGKLFKIAPKTDSVLQELKFANLNEDMDVMQALPRKRSIFGEFRSNLEYSLKITHIACGVQLACAISSTNGVYNIPSKIHNFPQHLRVQQLVCGFEHALLLTTNGDVYAWGNGIRGQLGQEPMGIKECPTLIDALAGIKITCIAAGGWHSAAISAFGDLYTCGFNPNGQLGLRVFKDNNGLKNPTVYPLPQLVDSPICCTTENKESTEVGNECAPLKVYTGSRHTFLQMSCGVLFASGWNAHGQLGLVSQNDFVDQFSRVKMEDKNVDIVCGAWCTIFKKR